jgi:hypothetical protein
MMSIACPPVVTPEWLENYNRFAQLSRPLHSSIEAEVPARAAVGNHPIKDVFPFGIHRLSIEGLDSIRWDSGQE